MPSHVTVNSQNDIPLGFVHLEEAVPDAILDVRYYSAYNFIGRRIDGYERATALLTVEAAKALKEVSDDVMRQGLRLKIYDAYRPTRAVTDFINWTKDTNDTKMKAFFYPNLDKALLCPRGYILAQSGHSRGSTVDLTLVDAATGQELDMGGTFDWFGEESHPNWCGNPETQEYTGEYPGKKLPENGKINSYQFQNRMLLRAVMTRHEFKPLAEEWWHFTLVNEPYPQTYFDFPVK